MFKCKIIRQLNREAYKYNQCWKHFETTKLTRARKKEWKLERTKTQTKWVAKTNYEWKGAEMGAICGTWQIWKRVNAGTGEHPLCPKCPRWPGTCSSRLLLGIPGYSRVQSRVSGHSIATLTQLIYSYSFSFNLRSANGKRQTVHGKRLTVIAAMARLIHMYRMYRVCE